MRHRVILYITHGERLLVMTEPHDPEAGLQVPGGTLEPEEAPDAAAMREGFEETGLPDLSIVRFLGERREDLHPFGGDDQIHGYFYHLRAGGDPPERWRHLDRISAPEEGPIPFDLSWISLREVPRLAANQGAFLSSLGGVELDLGRTVRLPVRRPGQL